MSGRRHRASVIVEQGPLLLAADPDASPRRHEGAADQPRLGNRLQRFADPTTSGVFHEPALLGAAEYQVPMGEAWEEGM